MYKHDLPPTERLRHVFHYDPATGHLYWRNPTHPNCTKGPIRTRGQGYLWVCLNDRRYAQHRVVWAMQTGGIPNDMEVDHINHVRDDNRWANLQLLTPVENQRKKPAKYKTRPLGQRRPRKLKLKQYPSGKWAVMEWSHVEQRYRSIGVFSSEAEARKVSKIP